MLWIYYRRGEAIPKELYYTDDYLDNDNYGNTLLMLWIHNRDEPIP